VNILRASVAAVDKMPKTKPFWHRRIVDPWQRFGNIGMIRDVSALLGCTM